MNPKDLSRRRRIRPSGGRGCVLLSAAALLLFVGCEGTLGKRLQANDPLLGSHAPPPNPAPIPPPNNTATQAAAATEQIPPLPSSISAPGTAAVAAGEMATPESGRELRITGGAAAPPGQLTGSSARGAAPVVSVGTPEPATPGSTSRLPAAAPTTVANIRTFEDAQQFLKQHGVTWQRLDGEDDGRWQFQCSIPNPKTPNTSRIFKTDGPCADSLAALRAVIAKIEQQPR